MLSLASWQNIRFTPLGFLDISYVIVLIPLMLILKVPMLIFSFVVIGMIIAHKGKPAHNLLIFFVFIIGIFALFLSLYGAFSFKGLSRLKLFLELLVYILIIVVSMQRLTREINFYLLISPMLFLALSLFFFHGMVMLVYVIFEIYILLWIVLSHRMATDLVDSFRATMVMFLYSLPWVIMLFIFFPRISFEHPSYGFRGEVVRHTGHDGTMFLDNTSLLVPSDRIVMEIGFDKEVPSIGTLYFRGSTLYIDKKDHWEAFPSYIKREDRVFGLLRGERTNYKVTLYPTNKKWIYLLDMPSLIVKDSRLDADLISTVDKSIDEPIHYEASSSLSPIFPDKIDKNMRRLSTAYNKKSNPKAYKEAFRIKSLDIDDEQKAKEIIKLFQAQSLTYSLKIGKLDMNNTTDSFLFDQKYGYCVHFASSFVTIARMVGIPSRIVTGYKSDKSNSLNNYLPIRERDAHAWSELYIDGAWRRYEATSTASNIEAQTPQEKNTENEQEEKSKLTESINLYLMYVKYKVETWILYYSNIRQLQLIKYAKANPEFILYLVLSLLSVLISSLIVISYFRRPRCSHPAICAIRPLITSLKKSNYIRQKDETLHQYLYRYAKEYPDNIAIIEVDRYYQQIFYGEDSSKESMKLLQQSVSESVKKLS